MIRILVFGGVLASPDADCYAGGLRFWRPAQAVTFVGSGESKVVIGPDFNKTPLIPAIAQDFATGEVLMLAYMNAEAFSETLRSGRVCYFSRSRNKLWRKGEESGNVQEVREVLYDCDADAVLVKVNQIGGAACHEGYKSCFFRKISAGGDGFDVVGARVFDPAEVYRKH